MIYVCRLPMGCPWSARGLIVSYAWAVVRLPVGCPWAVHGAPIKSIVKYDP